MASGATFHAKITADARQFIKQIEESTKALSGLVSATGKQATGAKGKQAEQEVKSAYQEAQKMANQAHQQTMQQIKQENAERVKGVRETVKAADYAKRTRAEGPVRPAGMGSRTGSFRSGFPTSDTRARGVTGRTRLSDEQQLVAQAQKQRQEQVLIRAHRDAILENRRRELNTQRQQLDAMVTGRYALYDMATAYQQVAYYAFQVTRSLTQTVQKAAEFETAFTAVERAAVLQEGTLAFEHMRDALIELSTQLPVTFAEISEIATLGAQMGVAAADLEGFTKTVAAFSAVTGASIDETAEKFGRISALAKVPVSEFENLASSVLFAGFNAVATEQEILSMSESIAAAAANAGYSAREVVGLATALSSLGIAPEQARGVILRVFNTITRAIEGSTDKLDAFAAAAGMSAEQAQYLWKESPEQFFTSLLNGLGSVEQLTLALDELGITNTREINVIQRLSGNMDVYTKSLREAADAYAEGSALQDIYGKTADNLDAKVQRLINTFEALQAEAGANMAESLKPVVEFLVDATRAVTEFIRTPIGSAVLPIITGFAALTAGVAGFRAITTLATAQMLAMRTALLKMGQMGTVAQSPIRSLIATMTQQIYVTDRLGNGTQYLTAKQLENMVVSGEITKKRKQEILANDAATVSTQRLGVAMRALSIASAVGIAVTAISAIYEFVKASNEFGKEVGGTSSLTNAIASDTQAFEALSDAEKESAENFILHTREVTKNTSELNPNAEALERITGASEDFSEQNRLVTEAIEDQTVALGANTREWIANAIIQDEGLNKILKKYPSFFDDVEELGLDFQGVLEQVLADPEANVGALVEKQIGEASRNIKSQLEATNVELNRLAVTSAGPLNAADQERYDLLLTQSIELANQNEKLDTAKQILLDIGLAMGEAFDAQLISEMVNEVLGVQDATAGADEEMEKLEDSTNGVADALRTVVDYAGDLNSILGRVIDLEFSKIVGRDTIAKGWAKIAENANKAAEAIEKAAQEQKDLAADRTILEYQLSVAERYGDETRAAEIRAKLAKVNNDLAKADQDLADAQAEASMGLAGTSDAAMDNRAEILGVIKNYRDYIKTLAELGRRPEQLAGDINVLKRQFTEQALAAGYAQDELEPYLDLFDQFARVATDAPRDVDVEVQLGLDAAEQAINEFLAKKRTVSVDTELETDGAEQTWAQKKAELEAKHPKLFLDVTPAERDMTDFLNIKREPNIVADRIDFAPADQKLNDWLAIGRQMSYSLKLDTEKSVRSSAYGALEIARKFPVNSTMYTSYVEMYRELLKVANQMRGYADGGLITGPGGPKSDSIYAKVSNGEYVIQAKAVDTYGVGFMNALNNQRVPMMASAPASAAVSNGSTVAYLAPEDRALLRAIADRPVTLYADNTKIAQSANAGNQTLTQRGLK